MKTYIMPKSSKAAIEAIQSRTEVACLIQGRRLSDGRLGWFTGFGPNEGAAWIDAANDGNAVLAPNHPEPGYAWNVVAGSRFIRKAA